MPDPFQGIGKPEPLKFLGSGVCSRRITQEQRLEQTSRPWPTIGTILAMVVSLGLLGIAMKSLPVGTAYAVRAGVGAVGTAILGIVLFNEPTNAGRLHSLALIFAGIIGLKPASPA